MGFEIQESPIFHVDGLEDSFSELKGTALDRHFGSDHSDAIDEA